MAQESLCRLQKPYCFINVPDGHSCSRWERRLNIVSSCCCGLKIRMFHCLQRPSLEDKLLQHIQCTFVGGKIENQKVPFGLCTFFRGKIVNQELFFGLSRHHFTA